MTKEETVAYIRHQMKITGKDLSLFSETAMQMIYATTQGTPRLVNHVCNQALYDASFKGHDVIEESHIGHVLADMERQRGTSG